MFDTRNRWAQTKRAVMFAYPCFVLLALAAKPTKEMLKLKHDASLPKQKDGPELLRKPYLCEGCRVVIEEVDQQIQAEISLRQRRVPGLDAINASASLRA